eukprot:scaffold12040_cov17-Tisochrysis_lutea.AAC.1
MAQYVRNFVPLFPLSLMVDVEHVTSLNICAPLVALGVRWVKYKKNLEDVEIQPPKILGGLKSPEYLAKNPQGKMPMLLLPDGAAIP